MSNYLGIDLSQDVYCLFQTDHGGPELYLCYPLLLTALSEAQLAERG